MILYMKDNDKKVFVFYKVSVKKEREPNMYLHFFKIIQHIKG